MDRRGFLMGLAGSAALFTTRGLFAQTLRETASMTEGPFYPDKLPLDTDNDLDLDSDFDADLDTTSVDRSGGSSTVTAMSFTAVTDARHQNKWMFDPNVQFRAIETYTFAVPDPGLDISGTSDLPEFSVNLPPGSVYVEAAGGAGETQVGRVIQHSPNPR